MKAFKIAYGFVLSIKRSSLRTITPSVSTQKTCACALPAPQMPLRNVSLTTAPCRCLANCRLEATLSRRTLPVRANKSRWHLKSSPAYVHMWWMPCFDELLLSSNNNVRLPQLYHSVQNQQNRAKHSIHSFWKWALSFLYKTVSATGVLIHRGTYQINV